ncbi:MAG: KDO2-lipid IV(A) lauroyltransferase [Planctomycetota bacterium]|jgi:KDO2-lipid IV(A) lauroyltransferase
MAETESPTEWPVPWEAVEGTQDGVFEHLSYGALRAFMAVFARMPNSAVNLSLGAIARLARRVSKKRSAAAKDFVNQALGPGLSDAELDRRVLQAYRHFFRIIYETEVMHRHIPFERVRDHFEIEMCDEARALAGSGQGCVLISPHVGNWEAAVVILPHVGFSPLYAVARPPRNKPMSIAAQRQRERFGGRILHRYGAMKSLPKILRAGGSVGLLLDQRARGRCVLAPYFGRPALCDRSVGVLLRRLSAPVLFLSCTMTDRPFHYRLQITRVIQPETLSGLSPTGVATVVNKGMEELVLQSPEEYFWIHDRYRDAPLEFAEDWTVEPEALEPFLDS